jgi:YesN/AraC family two-component response regulator
MGKIKLLLVDDHKIVRAGLRMLFLAEEDMEIVAEASSGAEALTAVAHAPTRCRDHGCGYAGDERH